MDIEEEIRLARKETGWILTHLDNIARHTCNRKETSASAPEREAESVPENQLELFADRENDLSNNDKTTPAD